jgi:hypothetical protein
MSSSRAHWFVRGDEGGCVCNKHDSNTDVICNKMSVHLYCISRNKIENFYYIVLKMNMDIDTSSSDSEISPEEEYDILTRRIKYQKTKKISPRILKVADQQYRRMLTSVGMWDEHMKLKGLIKEFIKLYAHESIKANFDKNKTILDYFWAMMKKIDNEIQDSIFMANSMDALTSLKL